MQFNSWEFAVFFLIVFAVFLLIKHTRFLLPWLLVASYVFYGWWNPLFLLLILYATALDFYSVVLMARKPRHKKLWLVLSMANNLFLLGFFKYAGFFTDNLNALATLVVGHPIAPPPNILLPVGISFFTFQSMSYTIDYYRGHIPQEPSFIRFAAFVAFFPQLVAGPIVRAADFIPQLRRPPAVTWRGLGDGLFLFMVGLFKKVAIADFLAIYVDRIYATPGDFGATSLIMATFAFGWQIYFDFSGYTDMARGLAKMMGYEFNLNFNHPYLAHSLSDFWNRWHISLSSWFKDYLYIPLGGNRLGVFRTYLNMALTMLISGLWHGATWAFIIWGALHALGRICTRELERTHLYRNLVPMLAKQALVFVFVTFTWIFFRAGNTADAFTIVSRMATAGFDHPHFPLLALALILAVWGYQYLSESRFKIALEWEPVKVTALAGMIFWMILFTGAAGKQFIYFQF